MDGMELGINLRLNNIDSDSEFQAMIARWQKIADKMPVKVGIKFDKDDLPFNKSGAFRPAEKNLEGIAAQVRELRRMFGELRLDDNMENDGRAIMDMFTELKGAAGDYGGTLDQAVKKQQQMTSESLTQQLKNLSDQWKELSASERSAEQGMELITRFKELRDSAGEYATSLEQAVRKHDEMTRERGLNEQLADLSAQWDRLTLAQRQGAEGEAIRAQFQEITSSAGEYAQGLAQVIAEHERMNNPTISQQLADLEARWERLSIAQRQGDEGRAILENYRQIQSEAGQYLGTIRQVLAEEEKSGNVTKEKPKAIQQSNVQLERQSRLMNQIKGYALGFLSIYGGIRLIRNIVEITGQFEQQQIAISSILRNAEHGEDIFNRLKRLAVVSPFDFRDLVSYARQLTAFSVPYEELYDTTKKLADAAAGLGVDMSRLILAYGQVRSAAVLRGQELRQFTEAGIPLVSEIARKFTELNGTMTTTGEVFELISRRAVSFEMIRDIMDDMTRAGGMFYMMQERQAATMRGRIKNIKDAWDIMVADIGGQNQGAITGVVEGVYMLIDNYRTVLKYLATLAVAYGSYKAAVLLVNGVLKAGTVIQGVKNSQFSVYITQLLTGTTATAGLTAAQLKLNKAMMGNAIGAVLALVAGLVVYFNRAAHNASVLRRELEGIANESAGEFAAAASNINILANAIKNATVGSQAHRDAVDEMNRQYGRFLPEQISVSDSFDGIAESTRSATDAMNEYYAAQAHRRGVQAVDTHIATELEKAEKDIGRQLRNIEGMTVLRSEEILKRWRELVRNQGNMTTEEFRRQQAEIKEMIRSVSRVTTRFVQVGGFGGVMHYNVSEGSNAFAAMSRHLSLFNNLTAEATAEMELLNTRLAAQHGLTENINEQIVKATELRDLEFERIRNTALTEEEVLERRRLAQEAHLRAVVGIWEEAGAIQTQLGQKAYQELQEFLHGSLQSWQQLAHDITDAAGTFASSFAPRGEQETLLQYLERLGGEYSKLADEHIQLSKSQHILTAGTLEDLEARKAVIREILDAFNRPDLIGSRGRDSTQAEAERQVRDFLNSIQREIDQHRHNLNIWETLSGDARLDFEVTFGKLPNLEDFIKAQMQQVADGRLNMDIDFLTNSFEDLLGGAVFSEQITEQLRRMFRDIQSMRLEDEQESIRNRENEAEEQERAIVEALRRYATYTQAKAELDREFAEHREALEKAGERATSENFANLEREYRESSERLLIDFAERAEWFTDFINALAEKSIEQMQVLLSELESQLEISDLIEEESVKIRQIIAVLRKQLADASEDAAPNNDVFRRWRQFERVLRNINKAMHDIVGSSNSMGAEIGRAIADISTSTLSVINGIEALQEAATEGMVDTAEAATESIKMVERASIILTIVAAAVNIIRRIVNLFGQISQRRHERRIEQQQRVIDNLRKSYEALDRQMRDLVGNALYQATQASNEVLRQQQQAIQRQIELERARSNKNRDDNAIKEWEEAYRRLGQQIEDNSRSIIESIAGTDIARAARDFAQSWLDAYMSFENTSEAIEKRFRDMAENMVVESILSEIMHSSLRPIFDMIDTRFNDDGEFSPGDIADIMRKAGAVIPALNNTMEDAMSYLESLGVNLRRPQDIEDNLSGVSRGIQGITEETALILGGYLNSIREAMFRHYAFIEQNTTTSLAAIIANQATSIGYLRGIEANTLSSANSFTTLLDIFNSLVVPNNNAGGKGFALNVNV